MVFTYIVPAIKNVNEVVDPTFTTEFKHSWSQLIIPFATTTLILAYPCLIIVGMIFLSTLFLRDSIQKINQQIERRAEVSAQTSLVFIVGFVGSVFYTLTSGAIGTSVGQAISSGVSFQLVLTNAVCDGLTLYVTSVLLIWASASWRCRICLTEIEKSLKSLYESEYSRFSSEYIDVLKSELSVLKKIGSIESENQDNKKLKVGRFPGVPIDILNNLSRIYSFKDVNLFDRILYRKVIGKDSDLSLFAGNRVRNKSFKYDASTSWFCHAIEVLIMDIENSYNNDNQQVDYKNFNHLMKSTWDEVDKTRGFFRHRPLIAIFVDLILAGVFAYSSIFFGLLGSGSELDAASLTSLFFGGFSEGVFTEVGPLFWIMHTTFIPSIVLWFLFTVFMFSAFCISPLVNWIERLRGTSKMQDLHPELMAQVSITKTGGLIMSAGSVLGAIRFLS